MNFFFLTSVVRLLFYFSPFCWSNSFSLTSLHRRFPICWKFEVLEHVIIYLTTHNKQFIIVDIFLSFSKQYVMCVKCWNRVNYQQALFITQYLIETGNRFFHRTANILFCVLSQYMYMCVYIYILYMNKLYLN